MILSQKGGRRGGGGGSTEGRSKKTDTPSVRLCGVLQYYNTNQKAVSNALTFFTRLKGDKH